MQVKIVHFYPDLMSLYGSYANVSVLRRTLEQIGHEVSVERVALGETASLDDADFIYLGAGTERAQKAALAALLPFADALKAAAARGAVLLFAGNAMELLGTRITDSAGKTYEALGIASFTAEQSTTRYAEDVYAACPLCDEPVVGFVNKCAVIRGVETPLLTSLAMGFGNDASRAPEGYRAGTILASELTGPLLVKNPALLRAVVRMICAAHSESAENIPTDEYLTRAHAVTAEQLRARSEKH